MNRKSKVLIKRFKSEKYSNRFVVPRLQGGDGSVDIWGCFNFNGVGVCNIYTVRINQHTYKETLENCTVPSVDMLIDRNKWWQFQQDVARPHTARKVKAWMKENKVDLLNPIESIWAGMDKELVEVRISSINSLKQEQDTIWGRAPTEICNNLVKSMQKRYVACKKARGEYFK